MVGRIIGISSSRPPSVHSTITQVFFNQNSRNIYSLRIVDSTYSTYRF